MLIMELQHMLVITHWDIPIISSQAYQMCFTGWIWCYSLHPMKRQKKPLNIFKLLFSVFVAPANLFPLKTNIISCVLIHISAPGKASLFVWHISYTREIQSALHNTLKTLKKEGGCLLRCPIEQGCGKISLRCSHRVHRTPSSQATIKSLSLQRTMCKYFKVPIKIN